MASSIRRDPKTPRARGTISGVVTCYNEEAHIAACLASLDWCDEIVVMDSFSTDRTVEIARAHPKVRLVQHPYLGDGAQKNRGINQARCDWVLILDADERCTPALRGEILDRISRPDAPSGFNIRRRCYFLGRRLRFSGWQHDRAVRLVRRGRGFYANRRVHAPMVTQGPVPVLAQPLEHHMIECLHHYIGRVNQYGYWGAAQGWRDGRRSGLFEVMVRPGWRFIRGYLVQLGILDGIRGLTFCAIQAYASFLKWSLLWSWHQNARRGRLPVLPPFDEDPAVWSGLERIRHSRDTASVPALGATPLRPHGWASPDVS